MDCIKALRVRWAVKAYKRAKLNTYRESIGLRPIRNWSLLNCAGRCLKILFERVLCCCLQWRVSGTKYTALEYLFSRGTPPNRIFKSFVGFICGLGSIYWLNSILKNEYKLSQFSALVISIVIGILLAIGLTFFKLIRLVCLLTAQQLFTNQARIALLTYALILTVSGPGQDYADNVKWLTQSLHCCMSVMNNAVETAIGLAKEPLDALAKPFVNMVNEIERICLQLKNAFKSLQKALSSLGKAIKDAYAWLKEKTEVCNNQMSNSFNECKHKFKEAAVDCVDKLGETMSFMCHVDALSDLCHTTKVADVICKLPKDIARNIITPIKNKMEEQIKALRRFADVGIHASYEFNLDLNTSKSQKEIFQNIQRDFMEKLDPIFKVSNYLHFNFAMVFIMLTIASALNYRYWYLNSDRHDNFYITRGLIRIDMERVRNGKEGIFPLKYHESQEYTQVYSMRMLKQERKKFKRNMILVLLSSIPILTYIFLDFALNLFIVFIRKHGAIKLSFKRSLDVNMIEVEGDGFMAQLDSAIVKALIPIADAIDAIDTTECFPPIKPPNYWRYAEIGALLLLCMFLVCTEAYGLRLRHVICQIYYPERQLSRDRWLYTHILTSRGSFFRYARSQIIAKLTGDDKVFRVGLVQRLIHTCPCGRNLFWFLEHTEKQCFLCGRPGELDDFEHFHECPSCESTYCLDCLDELERCPICFAPNDHSDSSSIDEESGSSSDASSSEDSAGKYHPLPSLTQNEFVHNKKSNRDSKSYRNSNHLKNSLFSNFHSNSKSNSSNMFTPQEIQETSGTGSNSDAETLRTSSHNNSSGSSSISTTSHKSGNISEDFDEESTETESSVNSEGDKDSDKDRDTVTDPSMNFHQNPNRNSEYDYENEGTGHAPNNLSTAKIGSEANNFSDYGRGVESGFAFDSTYNEIKQYLSESSRPREQDDSKRRNVDCDCGISSSLSYGQVCEEVLSKYDNVVSELSSSYQEFGFTSPSPSLSNTDPEMCLNGIGIAMTNSSSSCSCVCACNVDTGFSTSSCSNNSITQSYPDQDLPRRSVTEQFTQEDNGTHYDCDCDCNASQFVSNRSQNQETETESETDSIATLRKQSGRIQLRKCIHPRLRIGATEQTYDKFDTVLHEMISSFPQFENLSPSSSLSQSPSASDVETQAQAAIRIYSATDTDSDPYLEK